MQAKDKVDAQRFRRKQSAIAVTEIPREKSPLGALGGVASLAPLLRNLDGDQIAALADTFLGGGRGGGEGEGEGGTMDMLLDFAEKNPDVVKGLLEGITKGAKNVTQREETGYQV
jgi:hypothetical protein